MLSRDELLDLLENWLDAWNAHDLDGVMALFHEEVEFENWNGHIVKGKRALRRAWTGWFDNHGGFRLTTEETFVDPVEQKALYRWQLEWPSFEGNYRGQPEKRRGIDILHFSNGKVVRKLTYSKTAIEVAGKTVVLVAE